MAWQSSREQQEREEATKAVVYAAAVFFLVIAAYCLACAVDFKQPSTESLDQIAVELYQQSSRFAQGR